MMNRKKIFGITIGAILILASVGLAYALPPRVSWIPPELKPASIAPSETVTYTLTLKHTGFLPISPTNQLRIVPEGDIVPFVSLIQPSFPSVFKRGNQVSMVVTVSVPTITPLSVKTGELLLKRILPNGIVKEVWRADVLPIELTFSRFHLPPAPNKEEDQVTILGVDSDGDGVPDRVNRWIAFQAPESEKKRAAMTLSAKAQQDFLLDYLAHKDDNPVALEARVKGNAIVRLKTINCSWYVYGATLSLPGGQGAMDMVMKNNRELEALFMDTPERLRNFKDAERPLVATGGPSLSFPQKRQQCLDLGFNPDTLPN